MKTFLLDIVTPDGPAFQGPVERLVLPAAEGLLGVLPGHEPLVASMRPGPLHYEVDGKVEWMAVSGGFAQIGPSKVVLLVETAEASGAIDQARARARAEQKRNALEGARRGRADVALIEASLMKELARLKVAEKAPRP